MRIDSRFAFVFVWDCTSHRDSIVCLHISPTQMRSDCDATVNRTVLMYCILAAQCIHLTALSHSLFQFPKLGIRCRHARHSAMPHVCAPEPFQFIFPILSKWSAHNPRHRIFAANRSRCHPWSIVTFWRCLQFSDFATQAIRWPPAKKPNSNPFERQRIIWIWTTKNGAHVV